MWRCNVLRSWGHKSRDLKKWESSAYFHAGCGRLISDDVGCNSVKRDAAMMNENRICTCGSLISLVIRST